MIPGADFILSFQFPSMYFQGYFLFAKESYTACTAADENGHVNKGVFKTSVKQMPTLTV